MKLVHNVMIIVTGKPEVWARSYVTICCNSGRAPQLQFFYPVIRLLKNGNVVLLLSIFTVTLHYDRDSNEQVSFGAHITDNCQYLLNYIMITSAHQDDISVLQDEKMGTY